MDFSKSKATIDPNYKDKVRFANGEITILNANLSFEEIQKISEYAFEFEFDFKTSTEKNQTGIHIFEMEDANDQNNKNYITLAMQSQYSTVTMMH